MSINPYFVFLAQFRANLQERGVQNVKVTTIAQMAGKKWRQMSDAQKSIYTELAEQNRRAQKEESQSCQK